MKVKRGEKIVGNYRCPVCEKSKKELIRVNKIDNKFMWACQVCIDEGKAKI